MDWKKIYDNRTVSVEEAIKLVHSGDRIMLQHAAGIPIYLTDALVAHKENYKDVELCQLVPMGNCDFSKPGSEGHFRLNTLFCGAMNKKDIAEGRADFTPCYFSEVPSLFDNELPLDVAMVMVTPPDEHGMVSTGVSCDYALASIRKAKRVIAQVNDQMPRTHGETAVHVSQIDAFVIHNEPVHELPIAKIGDVEKAIGANCAKLVKDGDTLQLGIGAIPDAVLLSLTDKKDLGIHSEMISDGVVDLIEAGVVTNARKNFNPGKSVVTFLMGTKRLYDYADDNPAVAMYPVDYVNNPYNAAKNDNLVCINSCVQIDFTGQICSESVGAMQISGVGGQVDFMRAAKLSKGGRSIIAIGSTAAKGTISKIVPMLDTGAVVTSSRCDVDYVVTEYGIAKLKGVCVRERARRLIAIAHPKFRDDLIKAFEDRFKCKYQ